MFGIQRTRYEVILYFVIHEHLPIYLLVMFLTTDCPPESVGLAELIPTTEKG